MVAGSSPAGCAIKGSFGTSKMSRLQRNMVGVAQLVEHGIVTPVVVGSIPIVHPIFRKAPDLTVWRLFCFSGLSVPRLQVLGRRRRAFRRIFVSR